MEYLIELRLVLEVVETYGGDTPEDVRRCLAKVLNDGFEALERSLDEAQPALLRKAYEHRVVLR